MQVAATNSRVSGEEVEAEVSILVAPQNHWTAFNKHVFLSRLRLLLHKLEEGAKESA